MLSKIKINMTKKTSSSLTELRNKALVSRVKSDDGYQLPDKEVIEQPLVKEEIKKNILEKKGRSSTRGISFYETDEAFIRELQQFFFSKGKNLPNQSKVLRVALRLASTIAKENEYLLLSLYKEVEGQDVRRK